MKIFDASANSQTQTHRSCYKAIQRQKQNKIPIKKYNNNNTETEDNRTINNSDNTGEGEQKIAQMERDDE